MQLVLLGESFAAEDIARRLLAGGHEIHLDCKDEQLLRRLCCFGRIARVALKEALEKPHLPKVIWSADLSGRQLCALAELLPADTILLNSRAQYFEDNIRLAARLAENGASYIDIGTVIDEYRIALFVGGEKEAFQKVEPLLATIAGDGGYYHCGPAGVGHFLRCVQQKYEVLMQSALAEVLLEIKRSPFNDGFNLEALLIFGHLFCKKQPLSDSVWHFLRTRIPSALSGNANPVDSAAKPLHSVSN